MEEDDIIPCEFCFAHIRASLYTTHVRSYHSQVTLPVTRFLTDINSDDIEDDEDLDVQRYVTSSHQVDGNLRVFLQTHFRNVQQQTPNSQRASPGSSPPQPQALPILFEMPRGFAMSLEDVPKSGITDIDTISSVLPKDFSHIQEGEICVICQDDLTRPDLLIRKLTCTHMYCDRCIVIWMKQHTTCPVCQYDYY